MSAEGASKVSHFDILIAGAGPAGCAAALTLEGSGLNVALVDKAIFPRDKVCGDAIPGRAVKVLKEINPGFINEFGRFQQKCATRKTTFFYGRDAISFDWVQEAYTSPRADFDNFLLQLVEQNTVTKVFTNKRITDIKTEQDGIVASIKNQDSAITAKLLIAADGAQSVTARQLVNRSIDRKHSSGAVRAYYSNVSDIEADTTEVYFDKSYLPGYLWLFPLPDGKANIGIGMLSSEIAGRKIDLKSAFYEFQDRVPALKNKLKHAQQISPLQGFSLPLGSKLGQLSGERFMLAGDAASLIDPVSGDGIGNGMLSGKLAAEQALRCFERGDFSEDHMKLYDLAIESKLGKELRSRYLTQRLLSSAPFLLDAVFAAGRSKMLRKIMQKAL